MSQESIADWQRIYAELRGLDPMTLQPDPDRRSLTKMLAFRKARLEAKVLDTGL